MSSQRLGARTVVSALVLAAGVTTYANGSEATPEGYLPPMAIEGSVFLLARSDWFSVINFQDDWHAPRMRWVAGRWGAAGVHEGTDIIGFVGNTGYVPTLRSIYRATVEKQS